MVFVLRELSIGNPGDEGDDQWSEGRLRRHDDRRVLPVNPLVARIFAGPAIRQQSYTDPLNASPALRLGDGGGDHTMTARADGRCLCGMAHLHTAEVQTS